MGSGCKLYIRGPSGTWTGLGCDETSNQLLGNQLTMELLKLFLADRFLKELPVFVGWVAVEAANCHQSPGGALELRGGLRRTEKQRISFPVLTVLKRRTF